MTKDIYDLKLHEKTYLPDYTGILRVPGGWIYLTVYYDSNNNVIQNETFIPYNKEFMNIS